MVSASYEAWTFAFSNACSQSGCHKDVLNVTRDLCDGKQSCKIKVSDKIFGYPCDKSYQYSLEVMYLCGKSSRTHKWKTLKKNSFSGQLNTVNGMFEINCWVKKDCLNSYSNPTVRNKT